MASLKTLYRWLKNTNANIDKLKEEKKELQNMLNKLRSVIRPSIKSQRATDNKSFKEERFWAGPTQKQFSNICIVDITSSSRYYNFIQKDTQAAISDRIDKIDKEIDNEKQDRRDIKSAIYKKEHE